MPGRDSLRLFVAIELPATARRELAGATSRLRQAGVLPDIRWVRPEAMHLTLRFLGPVAAGRVPELTESLRGAIQEIPVFEIRPGALGTFGGSVGPRVVWVGMQGDVETLERLAGRVEAAVVGAGFPADSRRFSPHLTLGRVRDSVPRRERTALARVIAGGETPALSAFRVAAVSLMQSTLDASGARYEALEVIPLAGA